MTTNPSGAIGRLRQRISASRARTRRYNSLLGELNALSPQELQDLGIAPGSIRDIAWEGSKDL